MNSFNQIKYGNFYLKSHMGTGFIHGMFYDRSIWNGSSLRIAMLFRGDEKSISIRICKKKKKKKKKRNLLSKRKILKGIP